MKETPRRVGRVLFALAGVGSALFVHFLPAPERLPSGSPSGGAPAALPAPDRIDVPAPVAVRRLRAEKGEAGPPAAPLLAVDGSAAAEAAGPRAR